MMEIREGTALNYLISIFRVLNRFFYKLSYKENRIYKIKFNQSYVNFFSHFYKVQVSNFKLHRMIKLIED